MGLTLDWPTAAVILGLAGLYVYHAQGQRACACRECVHERHGHGHHHRHGAHERRGGDKTTAEHPNPSPSPPSPSPSPSASHSASPPPPAEHVEHAEHSTSPIDPAPPARSPPSPPPSAPSPSAAAEWDDPGIAAHSEGWDPVSGAYTDGGTYPEYETAPAGVIPRRPRVPVPSAGSWSARLGRDGDDHTHAPTLAAGRPSPDAHAHYQSALTALAPPFPSSPVLRDVPEHRKKIRAKLSAQFGRWECFPCERFHHSPEALLYHIRDVHKLDIAPHLDRLGAFERAALAASAGRRCEACDRSFRLPYHFAQHMRDKHGINAWAERAERAGVEMEQEEEGAEEAQGTGWEWVTGSAPERPVSPVSPLVDVHDVLGDEREPEPETETGKRSWSAVVRDERGWEDEYPALPSATTQAEPEPTHSPVPERSLRPASEAEFERPAIQLDTGTSARTPEIDPSGGSPPDAELVTPDGAEPAALELPPGPTLVDLFHYDEVPVDELEVELEKRETDEAEFGLEVEREILHEIEGESELDLAPASPTLERKTDFAEPDLEHPTHAPSTPGPTAYDPHTPARAPDASRMADVSGGSSLFAFTPTPHKFAWSRQHETSPLAAPRRLSTPSLLSPTEPGSLAASPPAHYSPQNDFPHRRRFSTHDDRHGGLQLERTLSSVSGVSSSSATSIWGPPDNARVYIPPLPVAGPVANPDAHPGWEFWPTRNRAENESQHPAQPQPKPQSAVAPASAQATASAPRLDAAYRLPLLPRPTPTRAPALAGDDVWSPKPAQEAKDLRPIFDSWVTLDDAQSQTQAAPAKPAPAPAPAPQRKAARTASPACSTASGSTSASSAKTRKGRRKDRERERDRDRPRWADIEVTYAAPVGPATGDSELYGGW